MPDYIDSAFLNQAQQVQAPSYLDMFYKSFNMAESLPWSARKQRERAIEDHQLAMQTARFQADMSDRAQKNQMEKLLFPHKLAQAQRLAAGIGMTTPGSSYSSPTGNANPQDWMKNLSEDVTVEPAAQPVVAHTVPDVNVAQQPGLILDKNVHLADPANPATNLDLIPDVGTLAVP